MMKLCRKCNRQLPLSRFNKDLSRSDNKQNKCQECDKAYRSNNGDKFNKNPIAANLYHIEYMKTDKGKQGTKDAIKRYRVRYPLAAHSRDAVAYAIKTRSLIRPSTCSECKCTDKPIHAHHCDYSKPLDIMWLCTVCHREWHKINKPLNRSL